MTLFWIAAAAMVALALALLLPTLARRRDAAASIDEARNDNLQVLRDQLQQLDAELAAGTLTPDQHRESRAEIERRALDEDLAEERPARASGPGRATVTTVAVGVLLPLFAAGLYARLGSQAALLPPQAASSAPEVTTAQVEAMVEQLATLMETKAGQPDELQGWVMLARSYAALQRFPEADKAYARANALAPDNAQLLADRADVMAMLPGQAADGEPARLVARALQLEPDNLKALALAGGAAFEKQDFATAVRHWARARELVPADSEFARNLDRSLVEARAALAAAGGGAAPASGPSVATAAAASAPATLSGTLSLAPALKDKIAPTDTVFIVARAAEGPRMPLAIVRRSAAELPIRFTLDDSAAMTPEFRLSKFPQVVVSARVSRTGEATPRAGDLLGQAGPLAPDGKPIEIVIDRVQP